MCIFPDCKTSANFNYEGKKGIYCSIHKLENMVNVKHKRCITPNCITRPTFNYPTETKALYCSVHKLENMINVKDKRCITPNCIKQPNFNYPNESKALYCSVHKLEGMVSTRTKCCITPNCIKLPTHNLPNKKPRYCSDHKTEGMIDNTCSEEKCYLPHTTKINNKQYCNAHVPENDLKVLKRLCKYCDIDFDLKYVCNLCKANRCKKEDTVVRHLRRTIDTKFIHDSSSMLQGCSKRRPDIYFELEKHVVIVEVDENQHINYAEVCECARINEIVNGIGGKSVIMIRFNPDKKYNKKRLQRYTIAEKLEILVATIKKELTTVYDEFIVKLIQLYYNDNFTQYAAIKESDITNLVCI